MKLMAPKYAAALFDLDNTLWDRSAAIHETEPAVRVAASAEDAVDKFAAPKPGCRRPDGAAGRDRV